MKSLSELRVLIVDDARANLDILVEGLKRDYRLSLALDGATALQLAARTPPDLILLDIMMPGLDGYEVCRRLRRRPETAEVPIMFLSSLEEAQDKARGFEAGANDYVTKPFEILEVQARVRSLLKAKAYNDAVKEQIAGELRVAREIQMGMIPRDFCDLERRCRVELAAVLEPAREVGGDLFGAFAPGRDRLVLVIGDVSGKGIPASLFMVRTSSLVRLLARDIVEPERILARLNDELSRDNPSGMFVTLLCAVFEPGSGRLSLANAGQTRPVLLTPGKAPRWAVERLGTALGFEPGLVFERTELELKPGETLLLYTDGVTEAFDPGEECYGNARLLADAAKFDNQSAGALTAGLLRKVRAFAAGAPQSDDLAILAMRVPAAAASAGAPPKHGKHAITLDLLATPDEVVRAMERVQAFGRERLIPEKDLFGLALAVEECGSNIVNHAYQGDARRQFVVTFEHAGNRFMVEFRDRGPAFDPTQAPARGPEEEPEERPPGGWGLELVRRYVQEIKYTREGDQNVLRLTRHLSLP